MNENNNKNLDFSYVEKKTDLNISFERIAFIFFVFFIISILFSVKVLILSNKTYSEEKILSKKENFRSSITDREGNILAKSVQALNLGIDPKLVVDKKKLLVSLKLLFPDQKFDDQIDGKQFFYVKKKFLLS